MSSSSSDFRQESTVPNKRNAREEKKTFVPFIAPADYRTHVNSDKSQAFVRKTATIHPSAFIAGGTDLEEIPLLEYDFVTIDEGVVIEADVKLGPSTHIHARATIRRGSNLGRGVIVASDVWSTFAIHVPGSNTATTVVNMGNAPHVEYFLHTVPH